VTLPKRPEDSHRLELGPDVSQRLIPHRRPVLMIDRVRGVALEDGARWAREPRAAIACTRGLTPRRRVCSRSPLAHHLFAEFSGRRFVVLTLRDCVETSGEAARETTTCSRVNDKMP
jgi:hypothetical protein